MLTLGPAKIIPVSPHYPPLQDPNRDGKGKLTFEPFMRINNPPNHDAQHRRAPHQTRIVHQARPQITPRRARQTQHGNHDAGETRRQRPDDGRELAQMPGAGAEAVADHEGADRDGDRERNEGGNGSDAEDGADGDLASEDE